VCTSNIKSIVIKTNRILSMGHIVRVSELSSFEGLV